MHGSEINTIYESEGTKTVTFYTNNLVSEAEFVGTLSVQNITCFTPKVHMIDISINRQEPSDMSCGDYKTVQAEVNASINCRSEFMGILQISVSCSITNEIVRTWTVQRYNSSTGLYDTPVNITGIDQSTNALILPQYFACFGSHQVERIWKCFRMCSFAQITLQVTMRQDLIDKEDETLGVLMGQASAYVRVVPEELVARVIDGASNTYTLGTDDTQILTVGK